MKASMQEKINKNLKCTDENVQKIIKFHSLLQFLFWSLVCKVVAIAFAGAILLSWWADRVLSDSFYRTLSGIGIVVGLCGLMICIGIASIKIWVQLDGYRELRGGECEEMADLIENVKECAEYRDKVVAIPRKLRMMDWYAMKGLETVCYHKSREKDVEIMYQPSRLFEQ